MSRRSPTLRWSERPPPRPTLDLSGMSDEALEALCALADLLGDDPTRWPRWAAELGARLLNSAPPPAAATEPAPEPAPESHPLARFAGFEELLAALWPSAPPRVRELLRAIAAALGVAVPKS